MKAAKKTVNENQVRLSNISKESKSLQKSLGAIRSFLLEYATELNLTQFEIKYLQSTKKRSTKVRTFENEHTIHKERYYMRLLGRSYIEQVRT